MRTTLLILTALTLPWVVLLATSNLQVAAWLFFILAICWIATNWASYGENT